MTTRCDPTIPYDRQEGALMLLVAQARQDRDRAVAMHRLALNNLRKYRRVRHLAQIAKDGAKPPRGVVKRLTASKLMDVTKG